MRAAWICASLCLPLSATLAAQTPSLCDPNLRASAHDPRSYRMRGNRCEGIYEGNRSADIISLVSFGARLRAWPAASASLTIRWPGSGPTSLRAMTINPSTFYRMDTRSAGGSYNWQTGFARGLSIAPRNIGLLAWTVAPQARRAIYLPVETQAAGAAADRSRKLTFLPTLAISEIYTTVIAARNDLTPGQIVVRNRKETLGYLPANTPFELSLPDNLSPGNVYIVNIAATTTTGASAISRFLIKV